MDSRSPSSPSSSIQGATAAAAVSNAHTDSSSSPDVGNVVAELVDKLGHPLVEIRRRAFQSLRLKLQAGIIHIVDIVHQSPIYWNILDLFNQDEVIENKALSESILALLEQLTQNSLACLRLSEIGAMSFLRNVKLDLPEELRHHVDTIVDRLLHVTPAQQAPPPALHKQESPFVRPKSPIRTTDHNAPPSPTRRSESRVRFSPRRSSSPTRHPVSVDVHVNPVETLAKPPPYYPNILYSYTPVKLSRNDLNLLQSFYTKWSNNFHDTIPGKAVDPEESEVFLIEEMFNTIVFDMGAHVILQKSRVFRSMLTSLNAITFEIVDFTLDHFQVIVDRWHWSFRKATELLSNNPSLPRESLELRDDSSSSMGNSIERATSDSESLDVEDYSISIPFASFELFKAIVPILREPELANKALRVLYKILPFLKLHLDSIASQVLAEHAFEESALHEAEIVRIQAFAFGVAQLRDILLLYNRDAADKNAADVDMNDLKVKDAIMKFTWSLTSAISANRPPVYCHRYLSTAFDYLLESTVPREAIAAISPVVFCHKSMTSSSFIQRMLGSSSEDVQKATLQSLVELLKWNLDGVHLDERSLLQVIENGLNLSFSDAYSVLEFLADNISLLGSLDQDNISADTLLVWAQALFSKDEGKLMQTVLSNWRQNADEGDDESGSDNSNSSLVALLRGLVHRDENCRRTCLNMLRDTVESFDASNCNAFADFASGRVDSPDNHRNEAFDKVQEVKTLCSENSDLALKCKAVKHLATLSKDVFADFKIAEPVWNLCCTLLPLHKEKHTTNVVTVLDLVLQNHPDDINNVLVDEQNLVQLVNFALKTESVSLKTKMRSFLTTLTLLPFGMSSPAASAPRSPSPSRSHAVICYLPQFVVSSFLVDESYRGVTSAYVNSIDELSEEVTSEDQRDIVLLWNSIYDYTQTSVRVEDGNGEEIVHMAKGLEAVGSSKSHYEFLANLEELDNGCYSSYDFKTLLQNRVEEVFSRFLIAHPASEADAVILDHTVCYLTKLVQAVDRLPSAITSVLVESASGSLVPILNSYMEQLRTESHENLQTMLVEIQEELCRNIIRFFRVLLEKLSDEAVNQFSRSCTVLSSSLSYGTYYSQAFSTTPNAASSEEYLLTVDCVRCINHLISRSSVLAGSEQAELDSIMLFCVSCIEASQQLGMAPEYSSLWFSNLYRNCAVCLRTLFCNTRFDDIEKLNVLMKRDPDMVWLMGMLHNQSDEVVTKSGWGILSSLVSMKGGSSIVVTKFPALVETAAVAIVDHGKRHMAVGKEALMLLNNILVQQAEEEEQKKEEKEQQQDEQRQQEEEVVTATSATWPQITQVLEKFQFFDRLYDLLNESYYSVEYLSAVAELLLNVVTLQPALLKSKFEENKKVVRLILDILVDDFDMTLTSGILTKGQRTLVKKQMTALHGTTCQQLRRSILEVLLRICDHDASWKKMYGAEIASYAVALFRMYSQSMSTQTDVDSLPEEPWQVVTLACQTLYEIIADDQDDTLLFNLSKYFAEEGYGLPTLRVVYHCMQKDDSVLQRYSGLLLAKLLTLHYGEVVDLGFGEFFESTAFPSKEDQLVNNGGEETLGVGIFRTLVSQLLTMGDYEDSVYFEGLRLSLQALLGRCGFAKQVFREDQIAEVFVERLRGIVNLGAGKIGDAQKVEMFAYVSILRHYLAGTIDAKQHGILMDLPGLLGDILTLKLRGFNIGLETMYCLRNLIASWDEGKRYLGEEQRAKSLAGSGNNSPSVVEIIVKYGLSGPVVSDDVVFRAVLDVLKLLCGNQEARKGMMKGGTPQYVFDQLCKLYRVKEFGRVSGLIEYFYQFTLSRDGQLHATRITNMVPQLLECATTPKTQTMPYNALLVLCNLVQSKENKPHLLADENLVPSLAKILQSKYLKLQACGVSLMWQLMYDFQKAKAYFKQSNLVPELQRLDNHLVKNYAGAFSKKSSSFTSMEELEKDMENLLLSRSRSQTEEPFGGLNEETLLTWGVAVKSTKKLMELLQ